MIVPLLALAADAVTAEPASEVHPVAWFGSLMRRSEQLVWADRRPNGVLHLGVGVAVAAATAWALEAAIGRPSAAVVAATVALGGRMLGDVAIDVGDALERDDLAGARAATSMLVGRDPSTLDEAEIVRAVFESVAENTVDAVTSTLLWTSAAGARGALVHRAVNTLDAMVGHRNERYGRFGWASARADDAVNWIPARVTAVAVAVVRPQRAGAVYRAVRRDARNHPSPNGGVVETAFAAALGVRLSGVNRYGDRIEQRGPLGDGPPPVHHDIARAVRLGRDVAWCVAALPVVAWAVRSVVRNVMRNVMRRATVQCVR